MEQNNWWDNIPENGVLCKDDSGDLQLITSAKGIFGFRSLDYGYPLSKLTPLTAAEIWQFMPWQSMDSAPRDGKRIIIICKGGHFDVGYWNLEDDCFKSLISLAKIYHAAKWLPLPEVQS